MKGYFRKRGNKWSFTIDIGTDPITGKRKQKSKSGFKTKKEAQAACAELISDLNKGSYVEYDKQKIEGYLQSWLEHTKHKIKESTFKNYSRAINKRIIPYLGQLNLSDLKTFHGQDLVDRMIKEGLSPTYIEYIITVLKNAVEYAVKTERIIKNPLVHVSIPRPRRRNYTTWSFEQVNKFLIYAKMDNPVYYICYSLALKTGMRKGEFLGLRWSDVNFESGNIQVTQTMTYDGVFTFSDPKTTNSVRTIAIDQDLITELKRHKAIQSQFKLAIGKGYNDHDLVCCREDGSPIYPRTLAFHFLSVIKKADIPIIRIHDMRHTHFTLLLELGEHPKIVSERAGHSSVKITLDVYSHVTPNMQQETASKFNNAIKNKKMS
ncbi:site-specific integrase [Metabacillus idriensis]|uniref:site-specific integrase n=1 Tax=Metabacillus idriensis TaxID=324768 RepID=UPI001749B570|nr:site-specific integrase [Metabacillus idriensis]